MTGAGTFALQALRLLPPETAHHLTLTALERGLAPSQPAGGWPVLRTEVSGLTFPNPLGLAAGFDKDARAPQAMLGLGLGFVEVGTVTPRAQQGNPRPRVFRLPDQGAVINRLGFNNQGMEALAARLEQRPVKGILGINLGANKDSEDRAADYETGLRRLYPYGRYFTVNVSSPNTPGLRDLQLGEALPTLLARLAAARAELAGAEAPKPLFLKIAPDIPEADLDPVLEAALAHKIDGLIISNTTIGREGVPARWADEAGGLSGPPLFQKSTDLLALAYDHCGRRLPLIGVGGIASAADAYAKIRAGASLLQFYTALIYRGPPLIPAILQGLADALERDGFSSVSDAVGADHR